VQSALTNQDQVPPECLVNDLCCLPDCCLPAEVHLNAEVFGEFCAEGRFMLYFYKSRIHGIVWAECSDLVVSERTRYDSAVFIHFYGTIIGSEFLLGISLSGCELYDQCCISVLLKGFFNTFVHGALIGPPGGPCCPDFLFDGVTNYYFCTNGGSVMDACIVAIENLTPCACDCT
jgi:hypothetical protein